MLIDKSIPSIAITHHVERCRYEGTIMASGPGSGYEGTIMASGPDSG